MTNRATLERAARIIDPKAYDAFDRVAEYQGRPQGEAPWSKYWADLASYAKRGTDAALAKAEQILTPDGGEAVHTGQLRDEPSSSLPGRDEAVLPEAAGWGLFNPDTKRFRNALCPTQEAAESIASRRSDNYLMLEARPLYAALQPATEPPADVVRLVKEWVLARQRFIDACGAFNTSDADNPFPPREGPAFDAMIQAKAGEELARNALFRGASRVPDEPEEGR